MDIGAQVAAAQDGPVHGGGPEVAKGRSPGCPAGEAEKASDQDSVAMARPASGLHRCVETARGSFLNRGRTRYFLLATAAAGEPVECRLERHPAEHEL